jgi:hypothetical protein
MNFLDRLPRFAMRIAVTLYVLAILFSFIVLGASVAKWLMLK